MSLTNIDSSSIKSFFNSNDYNYFIRQHPVGSKKMYTVDGVEVSITTIFDNEKNSVIYSIVVHGSIKPKTVMEAVAHQCALNSKK